METNHLNLNAAPKAATAATYAILDKNRVRLLTIGSDLLLINLGFVLAYLARYEWQWIRLVSAPAAYEDYIGQQLLLNMFLIITYTQARVWKRGRGEFLIDEVSRIISTTAAGIFLMGVVTFFIQPTPYSRLLLFWVLIFIA